jgi:23S rRNA (cytosine1962-C5)-methyltransferase
LEEYVSIFLNRNLRKSVLRGHPWIYSNSINNTEKYKTSLLAKIFDTDKEFLAWGIYSPNSPIALRILKTESQIPDSFFFKKNLETAISMRVHFLNEKTNALRLINGEGDRLPGLIADLYNHVLVLQFDGIDMENYWLKNRDVLDSLKKVKGVKSIVYKPRLKEQKQLSLLYGDQLPQQVEIIENHAKFLVDIPNGQKTGFFFDQRENRNYIREISKNQRLLNLYSYTGGFSVYGGLGGASAVTSVDISKQAIEFSKKNWAMNGLPSERHTGESEDVLDFLQKDKNKWEIVIVDPPSFTHSEKNKELAIKKYIEVFSLAARKLNPNGNLVLSSCSSHISFPDFFMIINESLSKARKTGKIHRVSGQGPDHPYPHSCEELRYLKFVHLNID